VNGRELVREALDSLGRMTYPAFKLIVVDNGIDRWGARRPFGKGYPGVTLIEKRGQISVFGEGNSVGMKYAPRRGGRSGYFSSTTISVRSAGHALRDDEGRGSRIPRSAMLRAEDLLSLARPGRILVRREGGSTIGPASCHTAEWVRQDSGQYDRVEDTGYITGLRDAHPAGGFLEACGSLRSESISPGVYSEERRPFDAPPSSGRGFPAFSMFHRRNYGNKVFRLQRGRNVGDEDTSES